MGDIDTEDARLRPLSVQGDGAGGASGQQLSHLRLQNSKEVEVVITHLSLWSKAVERQALQPQGDPDRNLSAGQPGLQNSLEHAIRIRLIPAPSHLVPRSLTKETETEPTSSCPSATTWRSLVCYSPSEYSEGPEPRGR